MIARHDGANRRTRAGYTASIGQGYGRGVSIKASQLLAPEDMHFMYFIILSTALEMP